MKVAFLTRYGAKGASSRVRALQFGPALAASGIEPLFMPLLSDRYVESLYRGRRAWPEVARSYVRRVAQLAGARSCDLIWIEKELLPGIPAMVELLLLGDRPFVLDFDDAVFHSYDMSSSATIRGVLGGKIDELMKAARLITVGNSYLEARATAAGARRIEQIPTVVDLDRYRLLEAKERGRLGSHPLSIVWIGSPVTARYLEIVREPLQRIAERREIELRVIGAAAPDWAGVRALSVSWAEATEALDVARGDIGIMPLVDSAWERGKCGYKLVQYMASGLPVVASPVGANRDIVMPGQTGFLAQTSADWEAALEQLAANPALRGEFGRRGRLRVESDYCVQAVAPRLVRLLYEAGRV